MPNGEAFRLMVSFLHTENCNVMLDLKSHFVGDVQLSLVVATTMKHVHEYDNALNCRQRKKKPQNLTIFAIDNDTDVGRNSGKIETKSNNNDHNNNNNNNHLLWNFHYAARNAAQIAYAFSNSPLTKCAVLKYIFWHQMHNGNA